MEINETNEGKTYYRVTEADLLKIIDTIEALLNYEEVQTMDIIRARDDLMLIRAIMLKQNIVFEKEEEI